MRSSNRNRNKLLHGRRLPKTLSATPKTLSTLLLLSVAISGGSVANEPIVSAAQSQLLASLSTQFATLTNRTQNHVANIVYTDKNNSVDPAGKSEQQSPWITANRLSETGQSLFDTIENAQRFGIDRNRLHYEQLSELLEQSSLANPFDQKAVDTLLTSAFKLLVTEVSAGRVSPEETQRYWFESVKGADVDELMVLLRAHPAAYDNILKDLTSDSRNIAPMLEKLAEYQSIQANGGWPVIEPGPTIQPGKQSERVMALRQRLEISGDLQDLPSSAESLLSPDTYTTDLQLAIERFQARHGLSVDALVGKATLAALNVTIEERIEQIELNIERHRWLPNNYASRHIITNIPDYRLRVIENGYTTLTMPVVVGKPKHQTPVFSEEMKYLVVNPTWTVPRSITNKELVPKELNSPGSLESSGFSVLDHSGNDIGFENVPASAWNESRFPYVLRQNPGKRNALGKVKFMMPNEYAIYLHDTPAKKLFKKEQRAYSHGCVRVGDPRALANHLLEREGWSQSRIETLFQLEETKNVHFQEPVPNHITYLTSWVDEHNVLQFRNDIYKLDNSLKTALANEAQERNLIVADFRTLHPVLAASE